MIIVLWHERLFVPRYIFVVKRSIGDSIEENGDAVDHESRNVKLEFSSAVDDQREDRPENSVASHLNRDGAGESRSIDVCKQEYLKHHIGNTSQDGSSEMC